MDQGRSRFLRKEAIALLNITIPVAIAL